jgi:hypothetical protein
MNLGTCSTAIHQWTCFIDMSMPEYTSLQELNKYAPLTSAC